MSDLENSTSFNAYQFPRWSTTLSRPQSSLPAQNATDMFQLGIDNRNQIEHFSSRRHLTQPNISISMGSRILSPLPLPQPTCTPDLCSTIDHRSSISSLSPPYQISPIRIKSSSFTIPIKTNSEEISSKDFPRQTHEQRKITQERKRQKQQAQKYAQNDSETWFQLRRSLAELKRLATTDEVLVDPSTSLFNCDGYSFEALKQVIHDQQMQQTKTNRLKSESGNYSSMDSMAPSRLRSRTSTSTSRSSFSRSRLARRSTETYARSTFEPFIVAAKPLHPLLLTGNTRPSKFRIKSSLPPRVPSPRPSLQNKRDQLVISDLSNNDDLPVSVTPSSQLQNIDDEEHEVETIPGSIISESSNRPKTPSTMSLKSTIKLKPQTPRSRSSIEKKSTVSFSKTPPRFILITDQEHRIESWYHQFPFIIHDDLLQSFESKTTKSTVSAYFIDESHQPCNSYTSKKTVLQGKPFHIINDWKKYDIIFISNNIFSQIISYLQTVLKSSGKIIHVHQINHQEDLKTQVRYLSRQISAHS